LKTKTTQKTKMQQNNNIITQLAGYDLPALASLDSAKREQMAMEYLSGRRKLSYSSFKKFTEAPNLFLRDRLDAKKEQTAAMLEGTVFHAMVLEPHKFSSEFTVDYAGKKPSSAQQIEFLAGAGNCKDEAALIELYKSLYAVKNKKDEDILKLANDLLAEYEPYLKFKKANQGKKIITESMLQKQLVLAQAALMNPVAGKLLEQLAAEGKPEHKVEFKYKDIDWIGYLDGYHSDFIIDLKKNTDASPKKVARQIEFDGWAWQAAFYSLAVDAWDKPYYLIAVDNNAQVSVTNISKEQRILAMRNINWYMNHFEQCLLDPDMFLRSHDYWASQEQ
jgi:hypothetical protein